MKQWSYSEQNWPLCEYRWSCLCYTWYTTNFDSFYTSVYHHFNTMSAIDDDVRNSVIPNIHPDIHHPSIISDSTWLGSGLSEKPSLWLQNESDWSFKIARSYFAKTLSSSTHNFYYHFLGNLFYKHRKHHWHHHVLTCILSLLLSKVNDQFGPKLAHCLSICASVSF